MHRNCNFKWLIITLFALALWPLASQVTGGSIVGVVTDQTGAVLPNAQVKATNIETNVVTQTVTNQAGYYEFPNLLVSIEFDISNIRARESLPSFRGVGPRR